MEYIKTDIEGTAILRPRIFRDERGYFMETWRHDDFCANVAPVTFVQDNESRSVSGVVRGLHFQRPPFAQAKLVRCVMGRVLDVAVDLRHDSRTYGRHIAVVLDAAEGTQLFIPKGFAHGYTVLSPEAVFQYKCDEYYHPEAEDGIHPFDPALGIDWHLDQSTAVLSPKDAARAMFDPDKIIF